MEISILSILVKVHLELYGQFWAPGFKGGIDKSKNGHQEDRESRSHALWMRNTISIFRYLEHYVEEGLGIVFEILESSMNLNEGRLF